MKKRISSIILTAVMIVGMIPASVIPTFAAEGNMAATADLTISTTEQWNTFAAYVTDGNTYSGKKVVLAADIGTPESPVSIMAGAWSEDNTKTKPFCGTFDGQGHTITLSLSGGSNTGVFSHTHEGAIIKNLKVTGTNSGVDSVGGIVGNAYKTTFINCESSVTVTGSNNYTGGIAGWSGHCTFDNCINSGTVSGKEKVGGIAGYADYNVSILNSINEGTVSGSKYAGGIVGGTVSDENGNVIVANCLNYSKITATDDNAGGIVGNMSHCGTVQNCFTAAVVNGAGNSGIVVGWANRKFICDNCYYQILPENNDLPAIQTNNSYLEVKNPTATGVETKTDTVMIVSMNKKVDENDGWYYWIKNNDKAWLSANPTKCDGISLTLGSDIYINFYMHLTNDEIENGTLTFDIGGRTVKLNGTDTKYNETEKKYYFACPITALEMAETVTATFSYNDEDYIQTYSVEDYIEEIVGNPDKYVDKAVMLAKKIANYGYYAQEYLASLHTNVHIVDSGDGYDRMIHFGNTETEDIDVVTAKAALDGYSFTVNGASDALNLYGTTVYFDSATALNYYVKVKDRVKPTAVCEGKDIAIIEYKGYTPTEGEKVYIVSVKGITATELADDIVVTINDELTITGSVLAYCKAVMNKDGQTDAAKNAMAAFYEYYLSAKDYEMWTKVKVFDIPTFKEEMAPLYDGSIKSVEDPSYWNGYDPEYMTIIDFSSDKIGEHYATFFLKQDVLSRWSDGTTTGKDVLWIIVYDYAILDEKTHTLTFKRDAHNSGRSYPISNVENAENEEDIQWFNKREDITSVVFDESFSECSPEKCAYWFNGCGNLTQVSGLQYLNLSNTTSVKSMFQNCTSLTKLNSDTQSVVDISSMDMSNITDASWMFAGCDNMTELIGPEQFSDEGCTLESFCYGCDFLTQVDFSNCDTSHVTSTKSMFRDCINLSKINSNVDGVVDISSFDMSSNKEASYMFGNCDSIIKLIGPGSSEEPTSFGYRTELDGFCYDCNNLQIFDFRNCDISNVENFSLAFYQNNKLLTVYLSRGHLGDASVTFKVNTKQMFDGGEKGNMALQTIYCEAGSGWSVNTNESAWMFSHCVHLVGGSGTECDGKNNIGVSGKSEIYARDDRADIEQPGYFTSITRERETINEVALSTVGENDLVDGGIYKITCSYSGENYSIMISDRRAENGSICYCLQAIKYNNSTWKAIFLKDGDRQNTGFVAFESVDSPGNYINLYGGSPKARMPLVAYTQYLGDYGSQWIVLRNGTDEYGKAQYHILSALDCSLAADASIFNENRVVAFYSNIANPDNINWQFERVE